MARTTVVALKQELIDMDAKYGDLLAQTVDMALAINALRAEVKALRAERVATVPMRLKVEPEVRVRTWVNAQGIEMVTRTIGNKAFTRPAAEVTA